MYIICPIVEQHLDDDGVLRNYNTAVLINRAGIVEGIYRKVFTFFHDNMVPSRIGVESWDLDFGRIGILTCFDANFPEVWQQASALEIDVLFWPSAYGGGMVLNAYAMLYHYYIVAAGAGWIIDITGDILNATQVGSSMWYTEIDLDRTFVHKDFNTDKVAKMMSESAELIEIEEDYTYANWWLFRSINPNASVRGLLQKYEIEPLLHYQARSRQMVNVARSAGIPPVYTPETGTLENVKKPVRQSFSGPTESKTMKLAEVMN